MEAEVEMLESQLQEALSCHAQQHEQIHRCDRRAEAHAEIGQLQMELAIKRRT